MRYRTCALLLGTLLLAPLASHATGPSVSAGNVWIREAPPGAEVMAGYLVLTNHTDQPLALAAVTSPDFGAVVVAANAPHAGTTGAQTVARFVIPAHQNITLAPGKSYLLLSKPVKPLFDGDLVTLTLNFSDGSALTILAPVRHEAPAR